jgi:flavin reductase (DIM6/NTAB) family NADH-FMN oxidoreductase RutF
VTEEGAQVSMGIHSLPEVLGALRHLPAGSYVLTAAFEGKRAGMLVHWVQPCADEPLLLCAAVRKGHRVEPLIRDSHAFAVCRIDPDDKLVSRKFSGGFTRDEAGDAFDSIGFETLSTGSPVIRRCICALDCEVVRHIDLEADHELYVGHVVAGRVYQS